MRHDMRGKHGQIKGTKYISETNPNGVEVN